MRRAYGQPSWSALSALVTTGARCARCGSGEDLVAHHKMPRRLGGPDLLSNLEPLCRSCHPRVEREDTAEAELSWERPELPEDVRPPRPRPHLPRLY